MGRIVHPGGVPGPGARVSVEFRKTMFSVYTILHHVYTIDYTIQYRGILHYLHHIITLERTSLNVKTDFGLSLTF